MCGIVGYIGNRKITDVLVGGLKKLEYRGYDSSGIALDNGKIIKSVGKVAALEEKINSEGDIAMMGIAHTRWATHGAVNINNAHPHHINRVTLVHNGIIENYLELKKELIKKGYTFKSETDSEVICALIDYYLDKDSVDAILKATKRLKGSYALLIMINGEQNLYALRKNSPLIVGLGNNENFVASDISAILEYTKNYYEIDEGEIFKISKDDIKIFVNKKEVSKKYKTSIWDLESAQKNGFKDFMLKEIDDEADLANKLISKYFHYDFTKEIIDLSKYHKIDIVACGSAYHAGLILYYLLKEKGFNININYASEYRYENHLYKEKTIVIIISQSGETADTIASMRLAIERGIDTLAITNVASSTISKEAKYVIPMLAGPEIAVATTKGYFSQVVLLIFLCLKLLLKKKIINKEELLSIINELKKLNLKELIDKDYLLISKKIYKVHDVYFIGRKMDYYVGMEASLKIKEISYIHSDTYPSGELKHGPIALIEDNTPVFVIITDDSIKDKTLNNAIEAKSRGAKLYGIVSKDLKIDKKVFDDYIELPKINNYLKPLASIIPFQLIAYNVALLKGCDIDKPKNLAKSVTVE